MKIAFFLILSICVVFGTTFQLVLEHVPNVCETRKLETVQILEESHYSFWNARMALSNYMTESDCDIVSGTINSNAIPLVMVHRNVEKCCNGTTEFLVHVTGEKVTIQDSL